MPCICILLSNEFVYPIILNFFLFFSFFLSDIVNYLLMVACPLAMKRFQAFVSLVSGVLNELYEYSAILQKRKKSQCWKMRKQSWILKCRDIGCRAVEATKDLDETTEDLALVWYSVMEYGVPLYLEIVFFTVNEFVDLLANFVIRMDENRQLQK